MPQLTKTTEDFRKLQALEATRLMGLGVKKAEACEQAGISIRQFDYWVARDDGAIAALQNAIIESERIRLADLTAATAMLLQELMDHAIQPGINIETLLKVLKYLGKLQKELEEKLGVNSAEDSAEIYLKMKGPATRIEASMMTKVMITPR